MNSKAHITFIAFIVGTDKNAMNQSLVNRLACQYSGFVKDVDMDKKNNFLQSYYQFLFRESQSQRVGYWAKPYQDAFRFGIITSYYFPISIPVAKISNSNGSQVHEVIGVGGIDVIFSSLEKFEPDKNQIMNELNKNQKECQDNNKSRC